MSDKEMKETWMNANKQNEIIIDLPLLINDFREKMVNVDKELHNKDILEYTAGLVVILFYGFKGVTSSVLMPKLGFLMVALYGLIAIFIVIYLNQFKKTKMLRISQIDYLTNQKDYLKKRIKLYNAKWHFVPLIVFNMMILYGAGVDAYVDIIILILGFLVLCAIYWKISISLEKEKIKYLSILANVEKILIHLKGDK